MRVRDGVIEPRGIIGQRGAVVERISDLRELALGVDRQVGRRLPLARPVWARPR